MVVVLAAAAATVVVAVVVVVVTAAAGAGQPRLVPRANPNAAFRMCAVKQQLKVLVVPVPRRQVQHTVSPRCGRVKVEVTTAGACSSKQTGRHHNAMKRNETKRKETKQRTPAWRSSWVVHGHCTVVGQKTTELSVPQLPHRAEPRARTHSHARACTKG